MAELEKNDKFSIIVQKYGGTSVGDIERIEKVCTRIARYVKDGQKVAVTVSAMGSTTDRLVALAKRISKRPNKRELDVLMATGEQQSIALVSMMLEQKGIKALSFTGQQAGFLTDSRSGAARIVEVDPCAMLQAFEKVDVVVVAGFQGVDESGKITTLGRGGSDTTAVAVAAALGAKECEIYTDTDGIYTTDPHAVPAATKLETIDYDEMLELASLGAGVLHPRSVWYARRYGVKIHVRSSFGYASGSIVSDFKETTLKTDKPVTGVALDDGIARVDLLEVPDTPGIAAQVFNALGEAGISADMIIQGVPGDQTSRQQLAFTIDEDQVEYAVQAIESVLEDIGGRYKVDKNIAKLSVVGIAVGSTPGIAARVFKAVSAVGANIQMITTSEVRVSVVISTDKAKEALKAVHSEFGLDSKL